MLTRIAVVLLILSFSAVSVHGQVTMRHKKSGDIFPVNLKSKSTGKYFGAGPTYMLGMLSPDRITIVNNDIDTFWVLDLTPRGKIGVQLEAGRFHILEYSSLFKYLDYGMTYAQFKGKEMWKEDITVNQVGPVTVRSGESQFSTHVLAGHIDLNNVKQYGSRYFMQNSIGLNANYRVYSWKEGIVEPSIGNSLQHTGKFYFQMHYKLGFGVKVKQKMLVIPSLETPIMNLWPFNLYLGDIGYFNSRYRPLILNVRILLFSDRFKRYFN